MDSGIGKETKSEVEKMVWDEARKRRAKKRKLPPCLEREVSVCMRERVCVCVCDCEREIIIELKSGRGGEWSTEALDILTFTYTNLCV